MTTIIDQNHVINTDINSDPDQDQVIDQIKQESVSLTETETEIPIKTAKPYTESFLTQLRDSIDKLSKTNHIEILRILTSESEDINENQYGVHINLSELPPDTINKICLYVQYVKSQEKEFGVFEELKDQYKTNFFNEEI
jgi:hypothetical protein